MDAQTSDIDDFAELAELAGKRLENEWRLRLRTEPPSVRSAEFLRRLLAWKLQEKAFGGLPPPTKRRKRRFSFSGLSLFSINCRAETT